jgi:serine/threonine protein kinase
MDRIGRMDNSLLPGRFEFHDLLGRGGMGEVYRALDTQTGETVAVKVLNPDVSHDPELLERFQREGEALRRLNHPNIVRMVTEVEENGRHYLVMEYVAGGSLEDLLQKEGRLPVSQVVKVGLEVADARVATAAAATGVAAVEIDARQDGNRDCRWIFLLKRLFPKDVKPDPPAKKPEGLVSMELAIH